MKELSYEEMIERLVEDGFTEAEAEDEIRRMFHEAAIEDGMGAD